MSLLCINDDHKDDITPGLAADTAGSQLSAESPGARPGYFAMNHHYGLKNIKTSFEKIIFLIFLQLFSDENEYFFCGIYFAK